MTELLNAVEEAKNIMKETKLQEHLREIRESKVPKIKNHKHHLLKHAKWIAELFNYRFEPIEEEPTVIIKETLPVTTKKPRLSNWAKTFLGKIEEWKKNNPEIWEERKKIIYNN